MLRKYFVYLEDGDEVYRVAIPARNEKEARKFVEGNGEVIKVKDVTDDYPISIDKVINALKTCQFGDTEVDLIQRTLTFYGIAE